MGYGYVEGRQGIRDLEAGRVQGSLPGTIERFAISDRPLNQRSGKNNRHGRAG